MRHRLFKFLENFVTNQNVLYSHMSSCVRDHCHREEAEHKSHDGFFLKGVCRKVSIKPEMCADEINTREMPTHRHTHRFCAWTCCLYLLNNSKWFYLWDGIEPGSWKESEWSRCVAWLQSGNHLNRTCVTKRSPPEHPPKLSRWASKEIPPWGRAWPRTAEFQARAIGGKTSTKARLRL